MLKRLTTWLLIFAVFAANFSTAFIYFGLKINQSYIAQNLCINRSRPGLHCNGHCYFMRKIKQAEENEKKQAERDGSVRLEVSFCQEPFRITFTAPPIIAVNTGSFADYTCAYSSRYKNAIFKPPPLV